MDRGAWQATVHGVARVGHDSAPKLPPPNTVPKLPVTSVGLSNFKFFLNRHLLSPLVKYGGESVVTLLTCGTSGVESDGSPLCGLSCDWRMFSSIPRPCPLSAQRTHLWVMRGESFDVIKCFLEMGDKTHPIPLELLVLVNRKRCDEHGGGKQ